MRIKTSTSKLVALSTLGVMAASTLGGLGMAPAHAGTKGKRNLAIGLGAVTAYGLIKKKKTVAIVGGLGTAYAYSKYRKSKKNDERRRRSYNSTRRYRTVRR